jgi:methylisocitrate lyase
MSRSIHDGQISGPRALRALIKYESVVRTLGAHDVLTATLIEHAGLESIFIGGFGASASMLGLPDMNFMSITNMTDLARRVVQSVNIPVIVDGDTGHGDLHNVQRTIQQFEQVGAAGVLLEDQISPKRCGHFEGKQVVPAKEMVLKIKAAIDARNNPDLVLIARTDARAVTGLEDAIERSNMYAEAGADICYVEAPQSEKELEEIPKRVDAPVMVNMLTGGKTPTKSVDELKSYGYKIIVWPIESVLCTAYIIRKLTRTLLQHGRVDAMKDEMDTFQGIQNLLGLPEILDLRRRMEERNSQK